MEKEKDKNMFYPPYPMYGMQIPGEDPMTTYMKVQEFLDKEKKKAEEDKKKKAKPEPIKYSFLETFLLAWLFGPFVGISYLYGLKFAINYVDTLLK